MNKMPNLFIVGAPKCGTTALHYYLGQHEDVYMSARKEPCFFASDFVAREYISDLQQYRNLFAPGAQCRYRGEATAMYLYSSQAAREIRDVCPEAICIVMLRNPADMMYSLHGQRLLEGVEQLASFEDALAAEPQRKQGVAVACSDRYPLPYLCYREIARFVPQVKRYLEVFPREQLVFGTLEALRKNTQGVVRSIESRLGLVPSDFDMTPQREAAAWKWPVLQRLAGSQCARELVRRIPAGLRSGLFSAFSRRRPSLDGAMRKALMSEFQEDASELQALTGLELLDLWQ
jgi:hypothetical protein